MEGVAARQVNTVMVTVLIRKFTRKRPGARMGVTMHLAHTTVLGTLLGLATKEEGLGEVCPAWTSRRFTKGAAREKQAPRGVTF